MKEPRLENSHKLNEYLISKIFFVLLVVFQFYFFFIRESNTKKKNFENNPEKRIRKGSYQSGLLYVSIMMKREMLYLTIVLSVLLSVLSSIKLENLILHLTIATLFIFLTEDKITGTLLFNNKQALCVSPPLIHKNELEIVKCITIHKQYYNYFSSNPTLFLVKVK